jgi:hypothetical protein
MLIRRGWSTAFAQAKFDIEVTDVSDLFRLLTARGAEDPAAVAASMTNFHVFKILDNEAKAYVHYTLHEQTPETEAAQRARHLEQASGHVAERDKYLDIYAPKPMAQA